ncbi:MAG: CapA family protein [Treponema sp.]|nr:CapA family protein [Treponema sp.]
MPKSLSAKAKLLVLAISALLSLALFSCQSAKRPRSKNLRLLFAGDIMAHTQNFNMADYSLIWDDIREQVQAADFSFANLESPVMEERPFESYPTFNMQPSYPAAALDAGFNLISLANNHSNDQGSQGIKATELWAAQIEGRAPNKKSLQGQKAVQTKSEGKPKTRAQTKNEGKPKTRARPVLFSGLTEDGQMSFREFFWHEYKIAFVAVTELLNTWKNYEEINYVPPTKKGRAAFVKKIAGIKEELEPDLFIVSVHTSEEEYVLTVLPEVQAFYRALLDAGADIVVSNHPHVVRPVELVAEKDTKKIRKVIIYANGNTISGQRRALNYDDPNEIWNYTGDGQIVELEMALDEKGFFALNYKKSFISAYTPQGERSPVIKRLDENFIHSLRENGEKKNSRYYEARLEALKKIKEIWTWR